MNGTCREKSILFIGYAASEAALDIMEEQRETLISRYPGAYLRNGRELLENDVNGRDRRLVSVKEILYGENGMGITDETGDDGGFITECGDNGVFGALWRLGEKLGCGLRADLMSIPIRQIAIEMCDLADVNPYESESGGCLLAVTPNPGAALKKLSDAGIPAGVAGFVTEDNDRVVINGESVRFLTKV